MTEVFANPTVKLVVFILAAVNEALLKFPGLPAPVYTVCGILAPVLLALLGGNVAASQVQLRRAKAEILELKGAKP